MGPDERGRRTEVGGRCEFDGIVVISQDAKAYFNSLKNLEGAGLSLEITTFTLSRGLGSRNPVTPEISRPVPA